MKQPTLAQQVTAEAIGTYLLVFFGCGVVHAAVLTGAQQGLWQVAIVWGIAIMLAAYSVGGVSGAHLNPAMTLAMSLWRGFPKSRVLPFIGGQMIGAFLAAVSLFVLFGPHLTAKELEKGVVRGEPGSIVTAMCYGEYFPNPGGLASGSDPYSAAKHEELRTRVPVSVAFGAELLGTLILGFVVFAVTDERNHGRPASGLAPVFIGLTVAVLIRGARAHSPHGGQAGAGSHCRALRKPVGSPSTSWVRSSEQCWAAAFMKLECGLRSRQRHRKGTHEVLVVVGCHLWKCRIGTR